MILPPGCHRKFAWKVGNSEPSWCCLSDTRPKLTYCTDEADVSDAACFTMIGGASSEKVMDKEVMGSDDITVSVGAAIESWKAASSLTLTSGDQNMTLVETR